MTGTQEVAEAIWEAAGESDTIREQVAADLRAISLSKPLGERQMNDEVKRNPSASGEVTTCLDRFHESMDRLETKFEKLIIELEDILLPAEPAPTEPVETPQPRRSCVATKIFVETYRTNRLVDRLAELIKRIDL